mgnify:CR=1 FL=1
MSDTFVIREFNGDDSRLEISDYGAQVLSWAPVGQPSVIWRPSALVLEAGVPIRGGVPVVTPWFGAGYAGGHALGLSPKHGSARLSFSGIARVHPIRRMAVCGIGSTCPPMRRTPVGSRCVRYMRSGLAGACE